MTINERVSDERLNTLANLQSHECMALPAGHNEVAMMARELQQYRAAAEPVAWVMKDDLADTDIISTPAYLSFSDAVTKTVGKLIPLYAAPQVTSVPDKWRISMRELVKAMRDYEMDVGEPAPYKHRKMIRRAELLLGVGMKEVSHDSGE